MSRTNQDIAREILDNAVKTYKAYPANQFAEAAACPFHKTSQGKIPAAPGERAYTDIISQYFQNGDITKEEATLMGSVNRTSVMGALMTLLPEWAIKQTLSTALENFTFSDAEGIRLYDNNDQMPFIMPAAFGNKSHEDSSPMHIDRDFINADINKERNRTNTNLTNQELIESYKFMQAFPEYGLAVKWLTGSITDLARTIKQEIKTNPDYDSFNKSKIGETLELLAHDGALALMDGRFPVAINDAILKQGIDDAAQTTPEKVSAAIHSLLKPNIFKRPRQNDAGEEYVGICPATRFNLRCVGTSINGTPALFQFIDKIKTVAQGLDANTNDDDVISVLKTCQDYSQLMTKMLGTPEAIEAQDEINFKSGLMRTLSKGGTNATAKKHPC